MLPTFGQPSALCLAEPPAAAPAIQTAPLAALQELCCPVLEPSSPKETGSWKALRAEVFY